MTGEDVCAFANLTFWTAAGVRVEKNLPEAKGLRVVDQLAGDGVVNYSAPLLAQALQVDPDLLEDGIGKVEMVLGAGEAPTTVFAWELVPTSGTIIAASKDQEQIDDGAPGLRHLMTYARVYPEVGGFDDNTDDTRLFGWMSKESTLWYDAADWSIPLSYGVYNTLGAIIKIQDWPDPYAEAISGDLTATTGQVTLYRTDFTLVADATVRVSYTGDDTATAYLDSSPIGETISTEKYAYGNTYSFEARLSAGKHTLAFQVTDIYGNRSYLLCSVAILNSDGTQSVIRRSDTYHWRLHLVSGAKPGWTAAAIILKLLQEAQDRGVYGLTAWTPDFTHALDSDGNSWPDLQEKAFPVGTTTLADAVRELEELACDVRVLPDFTFQAFVNQGSDVSSTVWLQENVNLLSLTYSGSPVGGTRALVRSVQGWSEVVNSTGETDSGRRELSITSGVSPSLSQGEAVGDASLSSEAFPKYVYTAEFKAVTGAVPGRDFGVGSTITSMDRTRTYVPMRVLSLGFSTPQDAPGPIVFTAELEVP